jgi:hypothetical protein
MAGEADGDSAAQIRALVVQIREELQRNERFLKATNHYYAHYQNRTYDTVYALLSLIEQHALVLDYPSI